jgi:serine/threonine protein phosphatase 1
LGATRTYVIGDIHGCPDELERLLEAISPGADDHLCFLGDYIDRGPSPRGVVERLIRLSREGPQCVFLKGNHEDMFLAYMGYPGRYGDAFLLNGGATTLQSYGVDSLSATGVAQRLPPAHLRFYLDLRLRASFGDFLCVHAGVRPSRPLDDQLEEDLLWIREEFISSAHPFPFTILFGHTPRREVLFDPPFKVGLDTGLVYGNKLSCLQLENRVLLQVRRGGGEVDRFDVAGRLAGRSVA